MTAGKLGLEIGSLRFLPQGFRTPHWSHAWDPEGDYLIVHSECAAFGRYFDSHSEDTAFMSMQCNEVCGSSV